MFEKGLFFFIFVMKINPPHFWFKHPKLKFVCLSLFSGSFINYLFFNCYSGCRNLSRHKWESCLNHRSVHLCQCVLEQDNSPAFFQCAAGQLWLPFNLPSPACGLVNDKTPRYRLQLLATINKNMDGWIDGWMNRWMDGQMAEQTDGWMDGWIDGWTDEQMDG